MRPICGICGKRVALEGEHFCRACGRDCIVPYIQYQGPKYEERVRELETKIKNSTTEFYDKLRQAFSFASKEEDFPICPRCERQMKVLDVELETWSCSGCGYDQTEDEDHRGLPLPK
jgi:ribosomal protein L37AE/L43A